MLPTAFLPKTEHVCVKRQCFWRKIKPNNISLSRFKGYVGTISPISPMQFPPHRGLGMSRSLYIYLKLSTLKVAFFFTIATPVPVPIWTMITTGWWFLVSLLLWMGQRNPAPPNGWLKPQKSQKSSVQPINWCRISLAHPLYGLPKPCALAICAQTVEILAFAELGRGSHKVTWGTPQWFWWMGFLKVGWLVNRPKWVWIKPGFTVRFPRNYSFVKFIEHEFERLQAGRT